LKNYVVSHSAESARQIETETEATQISYNL